MTERKRGSKLYHEYSVVFMLGQAEICFFMILHCNTTNTQKIFTGIRQQPSLGTQQRNKMQGTNDGECDINQLRPHRESLT